MAALSILGDTPAHLRDLAIAYALALPVGWSWERRARGAGVRTFPLVSIASCGFVLLAVRVLGPVSDSQARVLQGLIPGIAFLAAGAVLKEGHAVRGMANAASIWAIGAAGAAVGYGLYDIALVLAAIDFLTLWLLAPLKAEAERQNADRSRRRRIGRARARPDDQHAASPDVSDTKSTGPVHGPDQSAEP